MKKTVRSKVVPLNRFGLFIFVFLCLLLPLDGLYAQTAPSNSTLDVGMREQVVYVPMTLKDMYRREETSQIAVTIFRPEGVEEPRPLIIINHGRSVEAKRSSQGRARFLDAAHFFTGLGFVVMVPTRVGYWQTYGSFDPEYAGPCRQLNIEHMSKIVSDQVMAVYNMAQSLPYVDASRWLVTGVSVGGLTSVATVARAPAGLVGGINFSGGMGGDPATMPERPCNPNVIGNAWRKMASSAQVPMLWLYWENDKFWGRDVPRDWHQAWVDGKGQAEFVSLPAHGSDGHLGFVLDREHWQPHVKAYLQNLGFPVQP